MVDPRMLLDLATRVAGEAARHARSARDAGLSAADIDTKSTVTDLVTVVDRAVERLISERLRAIRPYDLILGEELGAHEADGVEPGAEAGRSRVRWIIDPIDGTVNFVYGIPFYAVSIAAEVDGVVVAAVVRNAATDEQWTAMRGHGAWRAGRRLSGSTVTELSQAMVGTGFGYLPARRAHQAAVVAALLPQVRDIRRCGAASLDLCFAAEGRFDAYFEKGLAAWDHAAGGLIATEAGLLVTGLSGREPGPAMVLAAPPGLHPLLHGLLVDFDAAGGP